MAQLKNHEADSWLARPGDKTGIVLIYGPDRGLVSERAKKFATATGLNLNDPFAVLRLDQADIADQPDRLMTEARTISMFGDKRLIWLRNTGNDRSMTETMTALCEDPPVDCKLLIEAGDLKKGAALRRIVEQSNAAMAVPCYSDSGRTIDLLIDEMLTSSGMSMGLEARQTLKETLGGDRLASRSELEKLQFYCYGKTAVEPDDVRASAGDVATLSQDHVVDSVLLGDVRGYDISYTRLIASGANPFLSLAAMMRQLQLLQLMRSRLDSGSSTPAAIVGAAKPPVFFSRRKTVETALSRWNAAMLSRALERLQKAILETRLNAGLSVSICRQTLLALCLESARSNPRR
ncbi:MAG: DNA polymerase III subunit delta [Rhizobiaceae bacterium]